MGRRAKSALRAGYQPTATQLPRLYLAALTQAKAAEARGRRQRRGGRGTHTAETSQEDR